MTTAEASLGELGARALALKRERYGDAVTFVRNRHLNYARGCTSLCSFCSFGLPPDEAPPPMTLDETEAFAASLGPDTREVHITGGLDPRCDLAYACALASAVKRARPDVHLRAFTATEVIAFARKSGVTTREVLNALRESGVDALAGGGAETLSQRLHRAHYPNKAGPEEWLALHEEAHEAGFTSNAAVLFGYDETEDELTEAFLRIEALAARTGGFVALVPVPYQPAGERAEAPDPRRVLRAVAAARTLAPSVPHVKAYWAATGFELASVALHYGADDLDGTIGEESVLHAAGATSPRRADAEALAGLIAGAGFTPVERDGDYNALN